MNTYFILNISYQNKIVDLTKCGIVKRIPKKETDRINKTIGQL